MISTAKKKILVSYLKTFCTLQAILILIAEVNGQSYSFINFSTANNIPSSYIYTISQSDDGFLWVGTGNGLAKFDGFNFHPVPFPDSILTRYPVSTHKDRSGRLWFGCNDGALFYTSNGKLVRHKESGFQSINGIFEADEKFILVVTQERIIAKINISKPDEIIKYYVPANIMMTSAAFDSRGNILLGTAQNMFYCRLEEDSVKIIREIEGIEYTRIHCITGISKDRGFLVGTEGSGIFSVTFRDEIPVLQRPSGLKLPENLDVRLITEAKDGSIWMATLGNGILKIEPGDIDPLTGKITYFSTESGLQGNDVRYVFEDDEGNIWAGLYGEGLSLLRSQAFLFYITGDTPGKNNIITIAANRDGYILGSSSGYYKFYPETAKTGKFTDLSKKINSEISWYLFENSGNVWVGTKGGGLFSVDKYGQTRQLFLSENPGQNYIRHIALDGDNLWVSTLDGIIILNKKNGNLVRKFSIEDRLPHNSINQIVFLNNGNALVATECDRLYKITLGEGVTIGRRVMSGIVRNKVLCYDEGLNNDIWAGTAGNGLFWFTGDSVNNITTVNGLFSNFCYSIHVDKDGTVLIGHERGFSKFEPKTGTVKVYTADFIRSANCNPSSITEDDSGRILIGTTEGLIVFDKAKEKKIQPAPKTNVIAVTINNVRYPLKNEYILPYNRYTIKIEYVGINFNNPESVYYSTKMDNWDSQWSEMKQERQVTYQLRDGHYRFNLISYSHEGFTDQQPVFIDFHIKTPYWRTWWFPVVLILSIITVIVFIFIQKQKARDKLTKFLEEELDRRTHEVVKQKEHIEMQNLEITDSINYARRIQASILPDVNKLKEAFTEAFVIFYPRDIVSGDFYWFDRIDNSRFVLACADSTGHGVPGAFMSMIGSTLLQDIISRKGILRPSQILTMLDKHIISTLNQNVDIGVSNDGMDMVICEINIPERHIRFASAMRPIIIILGGELYYIKGNKYSVGGETVMEKYFDDQEYYLGRGDSIYLFSDGFSDQFGGKDGKKMKIARFKSLIEDVHHLPMKEQKEIIEKFFLDWKGDYAQVDDVLIIGIRV